MLLTLMKIWLTQRGFSQESFRGLEHRVLLTWGLRWPPMPMMTPRCRFEPEKSWVSVRDGVRCDSVCGLDLSAAGWYTQSGSPLRLTFDWPLSDLSGWPLRLTFTIVKDVGSWRGVLTGGPFPQQIRAFRLSTSNTPRAPQCLFKPEARVFK